MQVEFTEYENKKSDKFRIKHWTKCHSNCYYEINRYGGIGWNVVIICDECKKSKNITDVSSW